MVEFILSFGPENQDNPVRSLDQMPDHLMACFKSWGCDVTMGGFRGPYGSAAGRAYLAFKDDMTIRDLACMTLDCGWAFWIQPSRFHYDETVLELHPWRTIEV